MKNNLKLLQAKPNTSSKVDEISRQAKNDAKNIDDGKTIEAINFIKEIILTILKVMK